MNLHPLTRESLVLPSSPLRRKSMLNPNTSDLPQNDDDAERMERRRNAEMEMRQRVSSSSPDKRKSFGGGAIAGLSAAQLAEHYANCIKLSAENKINAKNAFSLQLIDYMAMMLKKRDSKMDNFQVASCTLDASTKIYAYRVDCVHTDVLKMAGGLAAGSRKKNAGNDGEEDDGGGEGGDNPDESTVVRKKKTRKPKNTIAKNIETLNAKTDLNFGADAFFVRSAGNMGDCQPGDCHFLASLKVLSNCGLMLSSEMPYWNAEDDIPSVEDIDVPLPYLPDLGNKAICSVFSEFRFTSWSLDAEVENDELAQVIPPLPDRNDDFAFDVNAVPEPVPACDDDLPVDNFEVSGIDDGLDSDGEEVAAAAACAATRTPAAKVVDLRKHLSTAPSEYSYFRAGALDLWAGPSHWKIRPMRSTGGMTAVDGSGENPGLKKQKPKQKKELTINFDVDVNINVLTVESSRQLLQLKKRTILKAWSGEKNTHPQDVHYDCKSLQRLHTRSAVGVSIDPLPVEDNETPGYDYDNDHDTSEYCPNVAMADDVDDADDGEDAFLMGQHQDVHNSLAVEGTALTDAFTGDNLVAPPNKVARLFIPYAMRAKKVDMKKLKAAIWDILINIDSHKDVTDRGTLKVDKPTNFSYLYRSLPSRISSKLAENLSAPLAVVALLHLANEKNLHIEGDERFTDLTISQG